MGHFPHIDLLRGIAALLVLVYHMDALGSLGLRGDVWWTVPFRYGWIGVDLFLVISGFVITFSAAKARGQSPHDFRWPFMQRRLRRLLPLYALTCLIFVFLVRPEFLLTPIEHLWPVVLTHVLFLQNLSHKTHGVINGVTWSLALEMQFYLALILTLPWWIRLGALKSWGVLVMLAWLWRYGTTWLLTPGVAIPHMQVVYTTQLPGTLDAFGTGIALALWMHQSQGFTKAWPKPGVVSCLLWAGVSGLMLFGAAYYLVRLDYWSHYGMVVFWRTLLALGFGAALLSVMHAPLPKGYWIRPLHYLGEISYGIYLWHFLTLTALLQLTPWRGWKLLGVLLVATVLLASASWHLMEKHWMSKAR